MIKIFNSKSEYDVFTSNGTKLQSGDIYHIVEDSSYHFFTNNITGSTQVVDAYVGASGGGIIPSGNLNISTNGSNIDVTEYATVAVSVPASAVVSGTLEISANGSNIDVTDYASVDVNVAIPAGYVLPSGTLSISSNGEFDCTNYASVAVSVSASAPSLSWETVTSDYPYAGVGTTVKYLQLSASNTYVFKTASENVRVEYIGDDLDANGDLDFDDPSSPLGYLSPNTEYYFTAITPNGIDYSFILFSVGSGSVQYAILN